MRFLSIHVLLISCNLIAGSDVVAERVRTLQHAGNGICPAGEVPWPSSTGHFSCEKMASAGHRAHDWLIANMPPWDVINQGTLEEALVPATVEQALYARTNFSWAAEVPEDIWLNYVLPYANLNEARVDWRQFIWQKLSPFFLNGTFQPGSLAEVADVVNTHMWSLLRPEEPIKFKSSQTPLIYDPMSTIAFGYASCTGVSILYVDALRTFGVPARVVGTPAWHGVLDDGNHNWVEIWLGEGQGLMGEAWAFNEAVPAGPGEKLDKPCDKWFCNPSHFNGKTVTFAAQLNRSHSVGSGNSSFVVYPMSWDLSNNNIPGVDRTAFYNKQCGEECGKDVYATDRVF